VDLGLSGKKALVIGASRGIGRAKTSSAAEISGEVQRTAVERSPAVSPRTALLRCLIGVRVEGLNAASGSDCFGQFVERGRDS
jgi:NAD(P)-dependent dehydrogenase (short-subunit alcohol dehydrogenase family)